MKRKNELARLWVRLWLLAIPSLAHGASPHTTYSFPAGPVYPYGGLIQGCDGDFYGATVHGGAYGSSLGGYGAVYKLAANGTLATLASFSITNGAYPYANLVQGSDGNFYGTTIDGGAYAWLNGYKNLVNGHGTVFKVTTNGVLTAVYSFTGGNDGANPYAGLIQGNDGNLYGTTVNGGSGGYGTVFVVTTNGTLTTLVSFSYTNGATPYCDLVQGSDGNFYGTTVNGGSGGYGTMFVVTTNGTLTTLVSFAGTNGANPYAGLVQGSDGNFYGTTANGGACSNFYEFDHNHYFTGYGTVFQVTTNGTLTTLASFANTNGANPFARLVEGSDGGFYGTTVNGGANSYLNNWGALVNSYGTVFRATTNGVLTALYSFTGGNDGNAPFAGLAKGTDGNFYGTTFNGGTCGSGAAFMVTTSGAVSSMASFALNPIGANPYGGLVPGSDGNFYGTTVNGGTNAGYGTVFKLSTNGILSPLVSFAGTNGANPYAGLIQGSDGNFYGTTVNGGSGGYGTVFVVTTNGTLTTLVSFAGTNGANPYAGLVQGSGGNFYGTTANGGTGGCGAVFMVTTNGILTTLVSFAGTNGVGPYGSLVQGSDGNFYGTTTSGGTNQGGGTVFMVTTNGSLTTLVSFSLVFSLPLGVNTYPDGGDPQGQLVQDSDGAFYGTTVTGGTSGYWSYGTVFRATTNGTFTTAHRFGSSGALNGTSLDGNNPYSGLIKGSDDNFYGTTYGGGVAYSPFGTVFKLTKNGVLTTFYSFGGGTDGYNPYGGLVQGSDANLYGTTFKGGAGAAAWDDAYGTVFRLILAPVILNQPTNQTVGAGQNVTFAVGASGFGPLAYQWRRNAANIPGQTTSTLSLSNVTVASAANYSVAVSNPGGTTVSSNATLTVVCPLITVTPATLPDTMAGQPYSQTNTAAGGFGPYTFAITSGFPPPGVGLASSGVLSGTPTRSGNYTFTVKATDFYGCTGTNRYTLVVNCPTITLGLLPAATVGAAYNQTNIASGGAAPYTFAITGAGLPPGLVLSSSGVVSGTPTNAGNYSFTLRATDSHGCFGTNNYNLAVNCPAIMVSPAALPVPRIGTPYTQTNNASGGSAPYTFAVTSGSLPPGFALSGGGVLSGTPTNLGNYSFTLTVTDVYGCTGSQIDTLAVGVLFVNPYVDSNGWFSAQVVGPTGSTFVVLASTNALQPLTNWISLITNTAPSGLFDFADTNGFGSTNTGPSRFYRVRLAP